MENLNDKYLFVKDWINGEIRVFYSDSVIEKKIETDEGTEIECEVIEYYDGHNHQDYILSEEGVSVVDLITDKERNRLLTLVSEKVEFYDEDNLQEIEVEGNIYEVEQCRFDIYNPYIFTIKTSYPISSN